MNLNGSTLQVQGVIFRFCKFVGISGTSGQVRGPLVYLTLVVIYGSGGGVGNHNPGGIEASGLFFVVQRRVSIFSKRIMTNQIHFC